RLVEAAHPDDRLRSRRQERLLSVPARRRSLGQGHRHHRKAYRPDSERKTVTRARPIAAGRLACTGWLASARFVEDSLDDAFEALQRLRSLDAVGADQKRRCAANG